MCVCVRGVYKYAHILYIYMRVCVRCIMLHRWFHISSLPPPHLPSTQQNPAHRRETGQSWGWFIASRLPDKTEEVDHGQGEWGGWCQNPRKAQAQPERWRLKLFKDVMSKQWKLFVGAAKDTKGISWNICAQSLLENLLRLLGPFSCRKSKLVIQKKCSVVHHNTSLFEKQQAAGKKLVAYSNLERKLYPQKLLNNAASNNPAAVIIPKSSLPHCFFHPPQKKN